MKIEKGCVATTARMRLTVHADSGRHGFGLRLDFDFRGGGGGALIHREVNLELPADYQFTFAVRGDAPTNTLEYRSSALIRYRTVNGIRCGVHSDAQNVREGAQDALKCATS